MMRYVALSVMGAQYIGKEIVVNLSMYIHSLTTKRALDFLALLHEPVLYG